MISSKLESEKVSHWAIAFVIVSAAALLIFSQLSYYDRDEIEFVHTAWLILKGKVIYKDFFQHHHPLGYYFILPILKWYGELPSILAVIRGFYFLILMGICFYTYKVSRFFLDKNYSLLSACLLMTCFVFNYAGVKIRSDVPLLFFCMISFYYLIKYFLEQKKNYLVVSSFFSAMAFLVFQKAVFYLFSIFVVYIFVSLKDKKTNFITGGIIYLVTFLICVTIGYFSLIQIPFSDYFFLNWKINSDIIYKYTPWSFWSRQILYNPFLWLLMLVVFYYLLVKKEGGTLIKAVALHFLILIASMLLYLSPAWQYHLAYQPFLVIFSVYGLFFLGRNIQYKRLVLSVFVFSIFTNVCVNFLFASANIRRGQLKLISYAMKNSDAKDCVYDPYLTFNLFRENCDYFWFGMNPAKGIYYAFIKTRSYSYEIDKIINEKKPKLLSPRFIYPGLFFTLLNKYQLVSLSEIGIEEVDVVSAKERLYPLLIRKD